MGTKRNGVVIWVATSSGWVFGTAAEIGKDVGVAYVLSVAIS